MAELDPQTTRSPLRSPIFQPKPFISYAQNGEDVLLWRALGNLQHGCYIDVGAAEPEADSVTCAFYQRGWRGINLEPVPATFQLLAAARPDDVNLNIAAGDHNGTIDFFLVDGGNGLSTAIPKQAAILREDGWSNTQISVPVRTLGTIIAQHAPGTVHFLKIDAEGSERAVLDGADLRNFRPWIILIEATAPNSQVPTHEDWEHILFESDYLFAWFDGLNRFYVAAEHKTLATALQLQPNVFDGFVRRSENAVREQFVETQAALADAAVREQQSQAALADAAVREQQFQAALADAAVREQQFQAAAQTMMRDLVEQKEALAIQRNLADALRQESIRVVAERDMWMQDVFEANRFSAQVTLQRQEMYDRIDRMNAEIVSLRAEITAREEEVQTIHRQMVQLNQRLQAMYSSTSWKISKPMRAVAIILGRR